MTKYFGLRGRKLSNAVGAVASLAILTFGYNQSVVGGLLTTDSFNRQFPTINTIDTTGEEKHRHSTIQGTVIALYTASGTIGALACTFLADVFGRRRIIFGAHALQAVGVILMGTSFTLAQFIVARILLGLGSGGVTATASAWQTDLSKASSRGAHVSFFGVSCGIGLCLALWLDMGFSFLDSSVSWRFPILFQLVFSAFVLGFILYLPESPRWLVKMDRVEEAREILMLVHHDSSATRSPSDIADEEIREIQQAMSGEMSAKGIFHMGPQRIWHRICLGLIVQMFLQMSGISAVTAYASTIYESHLHFSPVVSKILAASSQFIIILGSCLCSWTVDRFGRRALMLVSSSGMAICLAFLAGLMSNPENTSTLKAAVFFLYTYYFVYTLGFLGIPFLYASEIAPSHVRGAACGLSTASSWLFNFLVNEVTPVGLADITWRYFIVFAVINAFIVPIIYFFYPETAGRQLEEIDEIFKQSNSIWSPVKVAKRLGRGVPPEQMDFKAEAPVAQLSSERSNTAGTGEKVASGTAEWQEST